jgi:hypothetical protein
VPDGYAVESLPKAVKIDLGAIAYTARYARNENTLTLARKLSVRSIVIGEEYYGTVKKFFGELVTADHDAVVLKKASA